jgi:exosortase F-associated protein
MKAQSALLRNLLGAGCAVGLVLVFLFQRVDLLSVLGWPASNTTSFIVNRTVRFLLNDALTIGLIYAIFRERKYVIFAFAVQLLELVFLLLPYFVIKVHYPQYNGPLISFLHRLVLNPLLLLLLIPAFYSQRRYS